MTEGARKRVVTILLVAFLATGLWFLLGWWLTSFSKGHCWLSSFVEITFALNTTLFIDKVRALVLRPFDGRCAKRIEALRLQTGAAVSDAVADTLTEKAGDLRRRLAYRIETEMWWMPYWGVFVAVVSLLVLLTDCPVFMVKFIPLLLSPVICFFTGAFVEFTDVMGEFGYHCSSAQEDVLIPRHEETLRKIVGDVPVASSEGV